MCRLIHQYALLIFSLLFTSLASATLTYTISPQPQTPVTATATTVYLGQTANWAKATTPFGNSCEGLSAPLNNATNDSTAFCSLNEARPQDILTITITGTSADTGFNSTTSGFSIEASQQSQYYQIPANCTGTSACFQFTGSLTATITIPIGVLCSILNGQNVTTATQCTSKNGQITIGWYNTATTTTTGGQASASSPSNPADTLEIPISFRYVDAGSIANFTWCPPGSSAASETQGFCYFTAYPGDSKFYVDALASDPGNPGLTVANLSASGDTSGTDESGMTYTGVFILAADGSSDMTTGSPSASIGVSTVSKAYALTPQFVDHLTNGVTYNLGMGSVDQAGIVTFFADPSLTGLSITPEKVYGLLDGKGCFIATAAYGSSMAPEVNFFREFRSQVLLRTKLGKWFTKIYYTYSPDFAAVIEQNEVLKFIVRLGLWPLLWFVKLVLSVGLSWALVLCFGFLFAIFTAHRKMTKVLVR